MVVIAIQFESPRQAKFLRPSRGPRLKFRLLGAPDSAPHVGPHKGARPVQAARSGVSMRARPVGDHRRVPGCPCSGLGRPVRDVRDGHRPHRSARGAEPGRPTRASSTHRPDAPTDPTGVGEFCPEVGPSSAARFKIGFFFLFFNFCVFFFFFSSSLKPAFSSSFN